MSLYARSDVLLVAVPEGDGGCGAVHTRPVTHGVPVKTWKLDCAACHGALKNDPLWAGTEQEIPETPDEKRYCEDAEKKSSVETQQDVARAFTELSAAASGNKDVLAKLTEVMSLMVTQLAPKAEAPKAELSPPASPQQFRAVSRETWDYHECAECGEPIVRTKGQRGALPKRCPDCKRKRAA